MTSRIWLASITAVTVAILATACNDTKTVHRTIPPIAGVTVGGPSDTNENGQVGVAVSEAEAGTVVGSTIVITNLSLEPHVSTTVTATAPLGYRIISVQGDVGDMIEVTLTSEGAGEGSHIYDVPSVAITNVASTAGATNEVHPGNLATISGTGFCFVEGALASNRIYIDGTALEPGASHSVSGDGFQFMVPLTISTNGTHSLQVTVGNTAPGDPVYTSNTLTFAATHPI